MRAGIVDAISIIIHFRLRWDVCQSARRRLRDRCQADAQVLIAG